MEEKRFCYARKKDEDTFTYVADAHYYILLRVCDKVAQVDIRIMNFVVLSFKWRLAWLENNCALQVFLVSFIVAY